jgi:phosphoesterase RecJ-like protein
MKISTVKVSVLFKEDKDKIRISFRSKGDIDVNTFARTYFEGGGHKNAAGGSSKKTLTDTLSYFESLIAQL